MGNQSGASRSGAAWTRLGIGVLAAGALLLGGLTWRNRSADENPLLVVWIAWLASAGSHLYFPDFSRACRCAAIASGVAYPVAVVLLGQLNEMLVAGMIVASGLGYALAFGMGLGFNLVRRRR